MLDKGQFEAEEARPRFLFFAMFAGFAFFVIVLRLIQLQLVQGQVYKQFSEKNRISVEKIHALRGKILDRNGFVLVDNRPSYDLTLTKGYVGQAKDKVFSFFSNQLEFDDELVQSIHRKLEQGSKYDSVTVLEDIPWETFTRVQVNRYRLPGVDAVYRPMRLYPHGKLACHALGYLREVSKARLKEFQQQGNNAVSLGDYIGVWGIEQLFDYILRGENGSRAIIEDAFGREIGDATSDIVLPSLRPKEQVPGYNLFSTIDYELQRATEEAFVFDAGAAVAMDPNTGDILALVSKPCFDLSKFSRNIPTEYWKELRADPLVPLYDRATMGIYPPASTFKMIVASAGLRHDLAGYGQTQHFQSCQGSYRIGRERKRCWKPYPGHGPQDVVGALKTSCDVFFYQLGLELGVDRIAEEARRYGLGASTQMGLNRERSGLVPSKEWKERVYKQPWVDGETASVAIGQGYMSATPLQMVRVAATIGTRGKVIKPRMAIKAVNVVTQEEVGFPIETVGDVGLENRHFEKIIQGMDDVVNDPTGTAYWRARSTKYRIAGKTGTAQVIKQRRGQELDDRFEDHGWFIAFAPVDNPQIAVAVLVENGGGGSKVAAPIAKIMIEDYLSRKIPDEVAPVEEVSAIDG